MRGYVESSQPAWEYFFVHQSYNRYPLSEHSVPGGRIRTGGAEKNQLSGKLFKAVQKDEQLHLFHFDSALFWTSPSSTLCPRGQPLTYLPLCCSGTAVSSPCSLGSSKFCRTVTRETIYIVESNSGGQNLNSRCLLLLYLPTLRPSLSLTISHHPAALSSRHKDSPNLCSALVLMLSHSVVSNSLRPHGL